MEFKHISVLKSESINGLNIKPNGFYMDGTTGAGGHSLEIAKKLKKGGKLVCVDRDVDALKKAKETLNGFDNVVFVKNNFCNVKEILQEAGIDKLDGILLDIGVSSFQIDSAERGFSYTKDAPLDMRMDKDQSLSAFEVVNEYGEDELKKIFFEYGEEEFAKIIAREIVKVRSQKPIETTGQLCQIIENCIPFKVKQKRGNPCKKVFQAIRIEVNGELDALKQAIEQGFEVLNKGGRFCIITFHSLEDRIVKTMFNEFCQGCICKEYSPICVCGRTPKAKLIAKKPILPTKEEEINNPRSKSAKLRIIEKII